MDGGTSSESESLSVDSFDDLSDEDVEAFKKHLSTNNKSGKDVESYGKKNKSIEDEIDEDEDESDGDGNESDEDEDESDEDEDESDEDENESEENESNASMTQQFSNIDMASEIEKGEAVKNQKAIWNRLLEARIKFQKLLILTNKLPQESLSNELDENFRKSLASVKRLMRNFLDLDDELLSRTPELSSSSAPTLQRENEDDEILSDTDEEMARHEISDKKEIQDSPEKGEKRKRFKDHNKELSKRFKSLEPYRTIVIQKFDEKTRLTTGKVTPKSFSAFDNSALKQIEQILRDRSRLVRRTQLKRSLYRVLGKPEVKEEAEAPKQDMLLKDYDPEIFDDDDFYRQILKDVIENKSFGMDPTIIRKQIEFQKVRNKMKRKVDTKASKGRKLRFDIHQKTENMMAPFKTCHCTDEERQSFLKCIFRGSK